MAADNLASEGIKMDALGEDFSLADNIALVLAFPVVIAFSALCFIICIFDNYYTGRKKKNAKKA